MNDTTVTKEFQTDKKDLFYEEPQSNQSKTMVINVDEFKGYDTQDYVQHAIQLRLKKGLHSEFYYVLDELVDKIKQYKDKTAVAKPSKLSKEDSIKKLRSSKKLISLKSKSSSKKVLLDRR